MKITSKQIAKKLRTERLNQQMSIETLSEKSGLSVGVISMFERQARTNIGLDNLLTWIHALKITPAEVFGSSDLEQINQKLDVIIKQTK